MAVRERYLECVQIDPGDVDCDVNPRECPLLDPATEMGDDTRDGLQAVRNSQQQAGATVGHCMSVRKCLLVAGAISEEETNTVDPQGELEVSPLAAPERPALPGDFDGVEPVDAQPTTRRLLLLAPVLDRKQAGHENGVCSGIPLNRQAPGEPVLRDHSLTG